MNLSLYRNTGNRETSLKTSIRNKQTNVAGDPVSGQIKSRRKKEMRTDLNKRHREIVAQSKWWLLLDPNVNKPTIKRRFWSKRGKMIMDWISNTRDDTRVKQARCLGGQTLKRLPTLTPCAGTALRAMLSYISHPWPLTCFIWVLALASNDFFSVVLMALWLYNNMFLLFRNIYYGREGWNDSLGFALKHCSEKNGFIKKGTWSKYGNI